ncbi:hypothetical protein B7494_g6616 [Chlorociboria aeruginascens]|nr:hypothetical protein B7494_g6616 [Chlorociboria aeruginascens]
MSYPSNQVPGGGYWPNPHAQNTQNGIYQQYSAPLNNIQSGQYWDENPQFPHPLPPAPGYSSIGFYPQEPAAQPIYQNSPAQYPHPTPQRQRPQVQQHIPTARAPPQMTQEQPNNSEIDRPMLLVSLAEEYFDAAHVLGPSAATAMTVENVEKYQKLIAMGLGCLDTALKNIRLSPRLEANIRLRYAGVLYEETDNFMEAETALSKGITLCERNHYFDLKYAMQYLLARLMFRNNPKASSKALDSYISDATAYRHHAWVYMFRFLRASQALESGNLADHHAAIHNLQSIASLSKQMEDRAIHSIASLMEVMAHLRSSGPEASEQIQTALAAAWTYQLDTDSRMPQLLGLTHILDVVCSLRQGDPKRMIAKLRRMQKIMDDALKGSAWSRVDDILEIPVNSTPNNANLVTRDTRAVLGIGEDGRDTLMMSFVNKKDAYAITYLLSGTVMLHKFSSDAKALKYLEQGLALLRDNITPIAGTPGLLPDLIAKMQWRGQLLCYFSIYLAFCSAAITDWDAVRKRIAELKDTAIKQEVSLSGPLGLLAKYLTGVYHQGIGDLDAALQIYQDERFLLSPVKGSNPSSADQVERDISILAAMNTLWIQQGGDRQDADNNSSWIAQLKPFCDKNPNRDIRSAFNIIAATVTTNPPAQLFKIKNYLRAALDGAQATANTQFLCITLSVMCDRFFFNVIGSQAEKSAMAASVQAKKSRNNLWMSVAGGMLARCYEFQGKKEEARVALEEARRLAQRALPEL